MQDARVPMMLCRSGRLRRRTQAGDFHGIGVRRGVARTDRARLRAFQCNSHALPRVIDVVGDGALKPCDTMREAVTTTTVPVSASGCADAFWSASCA